MLERLAAASIASHPPLTGLQQVLLLALLFEDGGGSGARTSGLLGGSGDGLVPDLEQALLLALASDEVLLLPQHCNLHVLLLLCLLLAQVMQKLLLTLCLRLYLRGLRGLLSYALVGLLSGQLVLLLLDELLQLLCLHQRCMTFHRGVGACIAKCGGGSA